MQKVAEYRIDIPYVAIAHKTKILNNAGESKNIAKTCRHFVATDL